MMRRFMIAAVACAVISFTWVFAQEDVVHKSDTPQVMITYSVGDLAVWTKNGQFDPRVLRQLLVAGVNDDSFEESDVVPFPTQASLIINANRDTQAKIQAIIEKLNESAKSAK